MNDKQAENCRVAYSVMAGFPAYKIDLNHVRLGMGGRSDDKTFLSECGAAGCVAGVLSAHPHFRAQGFHWDPSFGLSLGGREFISLPLMARVLFGASTIFASGPDGVHGKVVALARIRHALYEARRISQSRYGELERQELAIKE